MTVEGRDADAGSDSEGVARDNDGHRSTQSKMRCAPSLPVTGGRWRQSGKDQWRWATASCRCHDDPDSAGCAKDDEVATQATILSSFVGARPRPSAISRTQKTPVLL